MSSINISKLSNFISNKLTFEQRHQIIYGYTKIIESN